MMELNRKIIEQTVKEKGYKWFENGDYNLNIVGVRNSDTVTVYEDVLDTLFVDVIEYVEVVVYDTIVETEYVEFIEYITEYIDCETGLPCSSNIDELINKSKRNGVIYNINGQAIKEKEGLYIEDGKIKIKIN